jgi:hypothetical protein
MIQGLNTRSTIGKYRNLTQADWNAVLEQIKRGSIFAMIEASTNNRKVMFTNTEVQFILEKYGRAA